MKKILSVLLAAVLMAGMAAGCSNGNNSGKDSSGSASVDNSLKKVQDKGELILGLDDSFPPMGYRNDDNEIVGFDIDVAKEVSSRMGVKLNLQPISWDAKEQELNTGTIDCIWNGMSIDADREKAMNLSDPYMHNRMVLVVLGDSGYTSQSDLADKSIGVQNGSTAQKILEESDFAGTVKEIIGFKDNVTGFTDLEAKGIHAFFLDEIVANHFIKEQQKNYVVLEDGALADEEYAIGFRKADQALRDEVQKTLSEMKADGKLAEISTNWFGKDVTTVK